MDLKSSLFWLTVSRQKSQNKNVFLVTIHLIFWAWFPMQEFMFIHLKWFWKVFCSFNGNYTVSLNNSVQQNDFYSFF